MKAIKLLQGYIWHPQGQQLDFSTWPGRLVNAQVDWALDPVRPPVAFFADGTPTVGQTFYQFTAFIKSDLSPIELKPWVVDLQAELEPLLNALPSGFGWLLLEDLREV